MGKKKSKLWYIGSALLVFLVLGITFSLYNGNYGGENAELSKVEGSFSIETLKDDFSSIIPFKTDSNSQSFVFVEGTKSAYTMFNYKYLSGGTTVFTHKAGQVQYIGSACKVGDVVRVLYCDNNLNTMSCSKEMFVDMFYISKTGDYVTIGKDTYNFNDSFYFTYNCYEYKTSTTPIYEERSVYVSKTNTCITPKEATGMTGIFPYTSEKDCFTKVGTITTPIQSPTTPTTQTLSGVTNPYPNNQVIGDKGYFKDVVIKPSTASTYDSVVVTGKFIVVGNHSKILLETTIDPDTRNIFGGQSQSIVTSSASYSACDKSRYYVGKTHYNLKDGDIIEFTYTLATPQKSGEYKLNLISTKGCYNDVNYDDKASSVNFLINIKDKVFVTKDDTDGDGKKDLDSNKQQLDNCRYISNPAQEDYDNDNIGDSCDYCPMNKGLSIESGIVEKNGCHPCEGKALTDSCWKKDYSEFEIGDPRYDAVVKSGEGELTNEDLFAKYLEELKLKAESDRIKQEEQRCQLKGGEFINNKCEITTTMTCDEALKTNTYSTINEFCSETETQTWWNSQYCIKNPSVMECNPNYCDENKELDICGGSSDVCSINPTSSVCGGSGASEEPTTLSCNSGEYKTLTCSNDEQIISQVCDTTSGNFITIATCESEQSWLSKYGSYLTVGVLVGIVGVLFI